MSKSLNGMDGLFSLPTSIINNLVTSPTTNTSHIPAIIAKGNILNKESLLFFERILSNLKSNFIVMLYIFLSKQKN